MDREAAPSYTGSSPLSGHSVTFTQAVVSMDGKKILVPLSVPVEQPTLEAVAAPLSMSKSIVFEDAGESIKISTLAEMESKFKQFESIMAKRIEDGKAKSLPVKQSRATDKAESFMQRLGMPKSFGEYQEFVRMTAEHVAMSERTSPIECLESRIDPSVFLCWKNHAMQMESMSKSMLVDGLAKAAPSITVNVPQQAPPIVNVTTPEVIVNIPEQSSVIQVNVPESAPPVVNITNEAAKIEVNVEPAEVQLDMNVQVDAKIPDREKTIKIERDSDNLISRIVQSEKGV